LLFLAASALALVHFGEKAPVPATVRFDIPQPENFLFGQFIRVSPDGRNLVYATRSAGGAVQLWVRPLETGDSRPLEGTENTNVAIGGPFWSPDSRFIAFAAQGKLKKIEASGGPAQTLCDIQGQFLGGSWARDDKIVFGSLGSGGLVQVSAAGGAPSPLTTLDRSHQETGHGFPSFLPDGRHFFYVRATNPTVGGIFLGSIDAKPEQDSKRLLPDWSGPVYAQSSQPGLGYVLFVRAGTLMAQRFDTGKLAQIGDAFPIAERVANNGFSASDTGVLAYRTATGGGNTQFTWFDREGKVLGTAGEPGLYAVGSVSISPDGARLAAARTEGGNTDVWTLDFTRGMDTRFTFDPGTDVGPIWSPDGGRITYAATRGGKLGLYQKASNGAGQDELLLETTDLNASTSWSRDGRFVLYWGGTPNHVFVLSLPDAAAPGSPGAGKRKGIPIVKSEFNERGARFSPDGRFFSYVSNESGKDEIYVRPFDPANPSAPPGAKWMVSKGGGDGAHWRGDGKEIFYLGPGGNMTAVDVTTSTAGGTPVFQSGVPKVLFKEPSPVPFWDVTADGKKFLLQAPVRDAVSAAFKVVLNWEAGLKK
jgi:Tol biopolymer transport system component